MSLVHEHLGFVADARRIDAFDRAIREWVRPGDRVADLGSGTGILGLMCLEAGAGHVYAVDRTLMNEVARESFRRAGRAAQATVIAGDSSEISLPERVDVVIGDQIGFFGFDYGLLEQWADARERMLRPGGRLIPSRLRLHVAAVESPEAYRAVEAWGAHDVPASLHWLREFSVASKHPVLFPRAAVLTTAAQLEDLDLAQPQPAFHAWSGELEVLRDGILHGLAGWFDAQLAPGVSMTNSPLCDDAIRRQQAFLPIDAPVSLRQGERLQVEIAARPAQRQIAWTLRLPGRPPMRQVNWEAFAIDPGAAAAA